MNTLQDLVRVSLRNLKPWVLKSISLVKLLILTPTFSLWKYIRAKFAKNVWLLIPTTLKSMGAEAPILTGALLVVFVHAMNQSKYFIKFRVCYIL